MRAGGAVHDLQREGAVGGAVQPLGVRRQVGEVPSVPRKQVSCLPRLSSTPNDGRNRHRPLARKS